ncbi:MAG: hypothetical protein HC890_19780 [Chloroflexaceae bacterium]|nr:hypothetical protein [Chloroflexaceae bacterium]
MITLISLINLAIAAINFWVAWQVWQLGGKLKQVTKTLIEVEASVHYVLFPAPEVITIGQLGTAGLRDRYQKLLLQQLQAQPLLSLVDVFYRIWQQYFIRRRYAASRTRIKRYSFLRRR